MKHFLPFVLLCASSAAFADKTFEINAPLPPAGGRPGVVTELRLNPSTASSAPLEPAAPSAVAPTADPRPLIQPAPAPDSDAPQAPAAISANSEEGQPVRVFTSLEEAAAAGVNPLRPEPAPSTVQSSPLAEKSLLEKVVAELKTRQTVVLAAVLVLLLGGAALLWHRRKTRNTSE